MGDIVTEMKERLRTSATDQADAIEPSLGQPTSETKLAGDERMLGFKLPLDLKRLYLEIGNGGFGPGYGLIGLSGGKPDDTGKTAPEIYGQLRGRDSDDPAWAWPEGLLPICHWGCGIYSCIDCLDPSYRMRVFDPNAHLAIDSWEDTFFEECESFAKWIAAWCGGANLWERMYGNSGRIATLLAARERAP